MKIGDKVVHRGDIQGRILTVVEMFYFLGEKLVAVDDEGRYYKDFLYEFEPILADDTFLVGKKS